jgi:murein DD-endopeptidase MepM/ murein hydrolase activator NlpD
VKIASRAWSLVATVAIPAALVASDDARGAPALPAIVRPGEVFVFRPPSGEAAAESALFLGKTYPALTVPGERSEIFLLGVDLDAAPERSEIVLLRKGGGRERLEITISARVFPEERLALPPGMVTPPKELEERIAREQALAAEVYRTPAASRLWEGAFLQAIDRPAAGNFGRRRILNGIPKSPHAGQDYTAPRGTPVRAVAGGRVRLARDFYYSGLTLLVDHGAGLVSQYFHLEKLLAAEGDTVAAGQVIGRVGSTGRATGPHLHLGVRLFEQRVDPETLWGLFPGKAP